MMAVVATLLGLFVYCDRAFQDYRAAIAHEQSAEAYRWLRGLESDFGSWPWARFPESGIWSPRELDYLKDVECYHRNVSHIYRAAIYRPWQASPPETAKPRLPGDEHSSTLATLSSLFPESPSTLATFRSLLFSERIPDFDVCARVTLIAWLDEIERATRPMLEEGLKRYGPREELKGYLHDMDRVLDAGRRELIR